MKDIIFYGLLILFLASVAFLSCSTNNSRNGQSNGDDDSDLPRVFFTSDISPSGLLAVYEALNAEPYGNVAFKIHTGEPGNPHYLKPEFIKDLVQRLNGTIVETNVAYGGRRSNTAEHYKVAEEHGFLSIAPVVILDEIEDIVFTVENGKHLTENLVGGRFNEFDFHVVLSHFKGHQMGGFGGALKNIAIGYASAAGKSVIHSAGRRGGNMWDTNQTAFLESMVEAAKTITEKAGDQILYINVMNHLSVDCDCNGNPSNPDMADIGILASFDPVALDQACVDLVYSANDGTALIQRIESRNGIRTLEYAEEIGLGRRKYELVNID